MITGFVRERESCINLKVRGPSGQEQTIEAVIDTGYTASLSLPPSIIATLGLRWKTFGRGVLADGSECTFDVYVAHVEWDGLERRVLIDEADTDPLVGMTLMDGYELRIEIRPHGKVTLSRL